MEEAESADAGCRANNKTPHSDAGNKNMCFSLASLALYF